MHPNVCRVVAVVRNPSLLYETPVIRPRNSTRWHTMLADHIPTRIVSISVYSMSSSVLLQQQQGVAKSSSRSKQEEKDDGDNRSYVAAAEKY